VLPYSGLNFNSAFVLNSNTSWGYTLTDLEILSTQKAKYTNGIVLEYNDEVTGCTFINAWSETAQEAVSLLLHAHCIEGTPSIWLGTAGPFALSEHTAATPLPPPEPPALRLPIHQQMHSTRLYPTLGISLVTQSSHEDHLQSKCVPPSVITNPLLPTCIEPPGVVLQTFHIISCITKKIMLIPCTSNLQQSAATLNME
jgi:hypothetical protein